MGTEVLRSDYPALDSKGEERARGSLRDSGARIQSAKNGYHVTFVCFTDSKAS